MFFVHLFHTVPGEDIPQILRSFHRLLHVRHKSGVFNSIVFSSLTFCVLVQYLFESVALLTVKHKVDIYQISFTAARISSAFVSKSVTVILISFAIIFISSSFSPLVVTAGVPIHSALLRTGLPDHSALRSY